MVRWIDGVYGGLIAGFISAIFFLLVGNSIDHDAVFGDYFVRFATPVLGRFGGNVPLALCVGLLMHFIAAAFFGILYAGIAGRVKAMWSAPTSVICGITYGLVMYYVAEDVVVPVLGVTSVTPLWEALIGNVVFHGIILSEFITIAHRRNIARFSAA